MTHPDLQQRVDELIRDHSAGDIAHELTEFCMARSRDQSLEPMYRENWLLAATAMGAAKRQIEDLE